MTIDLTYKVSGQQESSHPVMKNMVRVLDLLG